MASRAVTTEPISAPPANDEPGDTPDRMFTIGELAALHSITTRTIRFYEAKGLIRPARKGVARAYARRDRARLILILRGKNLGFSLEEIEKFLSLYDADPSHLAQAQLLMDMVDRQVSDLQEKKADIERILRDLKQIRAQCAEHLAHNLKQGRQ
jgi:DNA-binding transcriptional MerR regulator